METTGNWSSVEKDKVHGRHRISSTVMPWTAVSILPACMGKDLRASVRHREGTGRKSVTHREGSSRGTDGDGTELSSPERSVPPATFGSNGWTTESQTDKEKGTGMQLVHLYVELGKGSRMAVERRTKSTTAADECALPTKRGRARRN
jgi:hypothetical protein